MPPRGLGLGLPICQRIAQGHGGMIVAQSEEGKGSLFTVSLPAVKAGRVQLKDRGSDYAGGFNGAMANAYAVNNSITASVAVTADGSHAGGFTGFASVGWGLELGTDDTTKASLLKQLTKAVTKLLSGSNNGAGELLSIVGVNPSVILGTQMKGSLTVKAGGDYADRKSVV